MKEKSTRRSFRAAHPTLTELVRFLLVGGLATVCDMFVMGVVLYAFSPSLYPKFYNAFYGGGKPSTVATVVGTGSGFVAGLLVNYILSVLFVFENKGKSKSVGGFFAFAFLSAVGLCIHLVGMFVGYDLLGINEWIVKIVLTLVVLVYNYLTRKFLLFRKDKREREQEEKAQTIGEETAMQKRESATRYEKISMVVPCYNEEACIDAYYAAMQTVRARLDVAFEYIFVDDGSRDATIDKIRALAAQNDEVRYISFSRNFGKEAAIYAGLQAASGDLVGLMDADLQDPPEMLLEMYEGIVREGYDCVACRRTDRKGESKIRSAFARLFYKLINKMSDADIMDGARDYRLMTRRMTDAVLSLAERERFSKGIFGWVGYKTKWLPYKNVERVAGSTKWSFRKLTKYAVSGIEDFSTAPLRFNGVLSVLCLLAAVAFAVFDIAWACTHHTVTALFVLLPVLLFLFCLLFCGLSILGAYVKKIFYESKARPVYLVRETEKDAAVQRGNVPRENDGALHGFRLAYAEAAATVPDAEEERSPQSPAATAPLTKESRYNDNENTEENTQA